MSIAKRLNDEFPGRPDPVLWIGDSCPKHGHCEGHPNWVHDGGKDGLRWFDPNYFTLAPIDPDRGLWGNATQYNKTTGGGWTQIWLDNHPDKMVLNEKLIDWQKNFYFLKYVHERYPDMEAVVHEKIWWLIRSKVPTSEIRLLESHISEDGKKKYAHHTHMHINTNKKDY